MKDEYIIINRTTLKKRIEELEKELPNYQRNHLVGTLACDALIKELKQILSQSTPLTPVLKNAWDNGYSEGLLTDDEIKSAKKDYISNLKLDI